MKSWHIAIASIALIAPCVGSAAEEKKGVTTQTAAEAAQRQGKTGTTNSEAAKQLQDLERTEQQSTQPQPAKDKPKNDPPKNDKDP